MECENCRRKNKLLKRVWYKITIHEELWHEVYDEFNKTPDVLIIGDKKDETKK